MRYLLIFVYSCLHLCIYKQIYAFAYNTEGGG